MSIDSITLGDVTKRLNMSIGQLHYMARQVGYGKAYRPFMLDQGRKKRLICAPRSDLKRLQRLIYDKILSTIPLSGVVYGCPGRNVVANARRHVSQEYMTVLDIQDCFPSTSATLVYNALSQAGMANDAAALITRLCTYQGSLPQGPPTSPALLNLVMRDVDDEINTIVLEVGAVYTRYMDDLCISGQSSLSIMTPKIISVLKKAGYGINRRKRREWGPHDRHTVTKIVVTTTLNPEPEFLKALYAELSKLERGQATLTEKEFVGKTGWIAALNPTLAKKLKRRWEDVSAMSQQPSNPEQVLSI